MNVRGEAAGFLVLALSGCGLVPLDSLIFFPDRDVPEPPRAVEERVFTTADGVRIHAWYAGASPRPPRAGVAPPAPPGSEPVAPTLIWSHGNGGNIADRVEVLLALAVHGLNVLAYDYRGYGRSEGRPSEGGVYRDAEAAYDSERARGVPASSIICFGESLGGAVSMHLATVRPCAGIALVSPFTTLRDVARVHYGPFAMFAGNRFDSVSKIAGVRVPVFIAHGDRDEIVPFALGERLYAAAPEPKRFFRAAGRSHNDVFASPDLVEAIATFAREVVGTPRG